MPSRRVSPIPSMVCVRDESQRNALSVSARVETNEPSARNLRAIEIAGERYLPNRRELEDLSVRFTWRRLIRRQCESTRCETGAGFSSRSVPSSAPDTAAAAELSAILAGGAASGVTSEGLLANRDRSPTICAPEPASCSACSLPRRVISCTTGRGTGIRGSLAESARLVAGNIPSRTKLR